MSFSVNILPFLVCFMISLQILLSLVINPISYHCHDRDCSSRLSETFILIKNLVLPFFNTFMNFFTLYLTCKVRYKGENRSILGFIKYEHLFLTSLIASTFLVDISVYVSQVYLFWFLIILLDDKIIYRNLFVIVDVLSVLPVLFKSDYRVDSGKKYIKWYIIQKLSINLFLISSGNRFYVKNKMMIILLIATWNFGVDQIIDKLNYVLLLLLTFQQIIISISSGNMGWLRYLIKLKLSKLTNLKFRYCSIYSDRERYTNRVITKSKVGNVIDFNCEPLFDHGFIKSSADENGCDSFTVEYNGSNVFLKKRVSRESASLLNFSIINEIDYAEVNISLFKKSYLHSLSWVEILENIEGFKLLGGDFVIGCWEIDAPDYLGIKSDLLGEIVLHQYYFFYKKIYFDIISLISVLNVNNKTKLVKRGAVKKSLGNRRFKNYCSDLRNLTDDHNSKTTFFEVKMPPSKYLKMVREQTIKVRFYHLKDIDGELPFICLRNTETNEVINSSVFFNKIKLRTSHNLNENFNSKDSIKINDKPMFFSDMKMLVKSETKDFGKPIPVRRDVFLGFQLGCSGSLNKTALKEGNVELKEPSEDRRKTGRLKRYKKIVPIDRKAERERTKKLGLSADKVLRISWERRRVARLRIEEFNKRVRVSSEYKRSFSESNCDIMIDGFSSNKKIITTQSVKEETHSTTDPKKMSYAEVSGDSELKENLIKLDTLVGLSKFETNFNLNSKIREIYKDLTYKSALLNGIRYLTPESIKDKDKLLSKKITKNNKKLFQEQALIFKNFKETRIYNDLKELGKGRKTKEDLKEEWKEYRNVNVDINKLREEKESVFDKNMYMILRSDDSEGAEDLKDLFTSKASKSNRRRKGKGKSKRGKGKSNSKGKLFKTKEIKDNLRRVFYGKAIKDNADNSDIKNLIKSNFSLKNFSIGNENGRFFKFYGSKVEDVEAKNAGVDRNRVYNLNYNNFPLLLNSSVLNKARYHLSKESRLRVNIAKNDRSLTGFIIEEYLMNFKRHVALTAKILTDEMIDTLLSVKYYRIVKSFKEFLEYEDF